MADRLRIKHIREAGHCVAGVRTTCEMHGFDMRRLVREGIPLSELEAIEDANVQQVVRIAKEDV